MTARRTRRRIVPLLAAGAALALLAPPVLAVPAGGSGPRSVRAATAAGSAVQLTQLDPVSPRPGQTLAITGTVANAGDATLTAVQVRLRLSPTALTSRAEIGGVVSGVDTRYGDRVPNTRTEIAASLAPGQTAPFRLSVPVDSLGLGRPGVYVLGVEATGTAPDGTDTRIGLTRSFLPWIPDPAAVGPTGVVTLWPLAQAPAVDADRVLLDESLPVALGTSGRLRTLLDTGAAVPGVVSWLVDPSLLETVSGMTSGYRVRTRDGVVVGSATGDAVSWLASARSVLASADVAALPYALPDDVALVRGGLARDVVRATTTAATGVSATLGRQVTSTVAWPVSGLVDSTTLAVLGDTGAAGVLLSDQALHPEPAVDFTPTGSAVLPALAGGRKAVVADTGLSAALVMPQRTAAEVVLARQRFVAELALVTLELPSTARTVVAVPPSGWNPSAAWASTLVHTLPTLTWARPTALSTLLAAPASVVPRTLTPYPARAEKAELPPSFVARIAETDRGAATLAQVTGAAGGDAAVRGALARSGSSFWRRERAVGTALLARTATGVATTTAQVRIVSRGSVSLPGETGVIPVTIANDLDVPVTVGLTVTGSPSVRLAAEPVAPVVIGPGRKESVEVSARVAGSGPVTAVLQLVTSDGRPYGAPERIEVGSAAYARAAAWVVGAAFLLLLALVAVNTVRRVRVARAARAAPVDDGTMTP